MAKRSDTVYPKKQDKPKKTESKKPSPKPEFRIKQP